MIRDSFIELLRISTLVAEPDSLSPMDDESWMQIFTIAKRQAVLGVMYRGIMSLPQDKRPPTKVKVRFALAAEQIKSRNELTNKAAEDMCRQLGEMKLRCCLLKGQGTAEYYPDPSLRQCGDLDIWVDGTWRHILETLQTRWKTGKVFYHHVDLDVYGGKPDVEIHFTPSWMNNPFINRRLQRYFKERSDSQLGRIPQGGRYPVPDMEFNLFFNILHIYRHLLLEGVGLRQIMDYYFMLINSDKSQRNNVAALVARFRLKRFTSALMYALKEIFLLDDTYLLAAPDEKYGRQLLYVIYRGGNFGRYDSRNAGISKSFFLVRFFRRMKRLAAFASAYPSEVLWAPYFKIKQYLWRLFSADRRHFFQR